jgi:hypothetical protein
LLCIWYSAVFALDVVTCLKLYVFDGVASGPAEEGFLRFSFGRAAPLL